ncbi:hypothetical protein NBE99_07695 [Thermosynechococcus sp. HN-54]|uniref:hypothetical protein n=1 Tax=Thermosynechococcus sp. HN-54 TaxID=2933959 RepID=UPI00202CA7E1|nr:hypothetical protein [Thermosynechococcus sp. HN-54]URR34529.1 hypothetical protein NBE99_07695 [Thermosynechococcus sp. HN-54]
MDCSILISFVGHQDPYSEKTNQEGSIVSLAKFLVEKQPLKWVLLLYTEDFQQRAIDTKDWLHSELQISEEAIHLEAVSSDLSADPINPVLVVQEAKRALHLAKYYQDSTDWLELNGSSGTPAMKAAWGILQAIATQRRLRLWQVRNPQEVRAGQARVFAVDLNVFRQELDRQGIQQQLDSYDYQGAEISLKNSSIEAPLALALIRYGKYRLARNYHQAFAAINPYKTEIEKLWFQEIAQLRQNNRPALFRDTYFQVAGLFKVGRYAEGLILAASLYENLLQYFVQIKVDLDITTDQKDRDRSLKLLQSHDKGQLWQYLRTYQQWSGDRLSLDSVHRQVLAAVLDYHYHSQNTALVSAFQQIEAYYQQRNDVIHQLAGLANVEDMQKDVVNALKKILSQVLPQEQLSLNPFKGLNYSIVRYLPSSIDVLK